MKLYTYFRSSAAYRVRIALNWKGIAVEQAFVDLRKDGGQQHAPEYAALNPQRLVPLLVDGDFVLGQSLAILEYLEETHPQPPLLPAQPQARAHARALAYAVCCEIHPLQNQRVQKHLQHQLGQSPEAVLAWVQHYIANGLADVEAMLARRPASTFCVGEAPTIADVCLVPQLYNAHRYGVDVTPFPTLQRIDASCRALPAFARAAPEQQPDAS